jgi:hypothetical protein
MDTPTPASPVRPYYRMRRPNQDGPPPSDSEFKGWLVETATAWTLDFPSLRVEHDVLVRDTSEAYERQIDVLLLPFGPLTTREQCIVIECKNEARQVDLERVDAFVGKLLDIGVPPDRGWYVSVKGFVPNAVQRAGKAGIESLELTGIEAEQRLKAEVYEALQSTVFILAAVEQSNIVHDIVAQSAHPNELLYLYDERGCRGSHLDIMWFAWRCGDIGPDLGTHLIEIKVPDNWFSVLSGNRCHFVAIGFTVRVTAHVHTITGQGRHHSLVRTADRTPHSQRGEVAFHADPGAYVLQTFQTEKALTEYLSSSGKDHLIQRVSVPRLLALSKLYWPPSDEVMQRLDDAQARSDRGEGPPPDLLGFAELEGTDIARAWERASQYYAVLEEALRSGDRAPGAVSSALIEVIDFVVPEPAEQEPDGAEAEP